MEREQAELLTWKVLDGEATPSEEEALEAATRESAEIRELRDQIRSEHQGFQRLAEIRASIQMDEETLQTAFENVAARAGAEAQTLRSLERRNAPAATGQSKSAALWARIFQPLPNFVGAAVGAAAALGVLFPIMRGAQVATQGGPMLFRGYAEALPQSDLDTGSSPELVFRNFDQRLARQESALSIPDFGAVREIAETEVLLGVSVRKLHELLDAPDPNYAEASAMIAEVFAAYPEVKTACTCDTFRFHAIAANVFRESGDFPEAGSALVTAGECLKLLGPCSAPE